MKNLMIENLIALSFGEGLGEAAFVDVYKPAGMYNVQFTMNNLASGVYLFRLKAGDPSTGSGQSFIQTKKMVLLR